MRLVLGYLILITARDCDSDLDEIKMLLDEAQILTVMENRRSFKQLKYIVYYLLELYHKKNASRNVNPRPKWWLKSVPFSRPYVGPKDLNPRDAKKALLKIIKSYLTYNGTNMIFRQVYSSALRIRELDGPKQISAKFADINFTGASKSTVIKNKSASKLIVKTVSKKNVNVVINNKKPARKILIKKINTQLLNKKVRDKKLNVKQLPKTNSTNKKASSSKRRTLLPPDKLKLKDKEQDSKLFIKESDLQQLIPCTSVNLFDVVKYGPVINTKEEFLQQLNLLQKDVLWKLSFLKYKKKLRNTEKDFVKSSANLHTAWPRLDNKNAVSASNSKNNKSDTSVSVISRKDVKTVNQQVMDEIVVNPPPPPMKLNSPQCIASNRTSLQKTKKSLSPKSIKKSPPLSPKTNNNTPNKSTTTAKKLSSRKTPKKSLSTTTSTKSKKSPSKIKASLSNSSKKLSKKPLPTSPAQETPISSNKESSKTLALTNKINLKLKQLIIKKKKLELSQKSGKLNKKSTKAKRSIIKIKWPVVKKSSVIKIS